MGGTPGAFGVESDSGGNAGRRDGAAGAGAGAADGTDDTEVEAVTTGDDWITPELPFAVRTSRDRVAAFTVLFGLASCELAAECGC